MLTFSVVYSFIGFVLLQKSFPILDLIDAYHKLFPPVGFFFPIFNSFFSSSLFFLKKLLLEWVAFISHSHPFGHLFVCFYVYGCFAPVYVCAPDAYSVPGTRRGSQTRWDSR